MAIERQTIIVCHATGDALHRLLASATFAASRLALVVRLAAVAWVLEAAPTSQTIGTLVPNAARRYALIVVLTNTAELFALHIGCQGAGIVL